MLKFFPEYDGFGYGWGQTPAYSMLIHLFDFLEIRTGTKGSNSIYVILLCSWKHGPIVIDAK